MKTKVFLIAFFILNICQMSAQDNDEVTLVVSADGVNKEEAVKTALRSAIEQAYGTFVSSNTSILNDELVKDEIVTLSFGNIKDYKELSNDTLPNGNVFTTLQAIVSISQLANYAKSKGAEVEFAGATFAMNLKMEELNTRNEEIIVANMLSAMEKLYMTGFDYQIQVSQPKVDGRMDADIDVRANNNALQAYALFHNTLESISLNQTKREEYNVIEKKTYRVDFLTKRYYLRSYQTLMLLNQFFNYIYPKAILNICIGTDTKISQIELISSYGSSGNWYDKDNNNKRRFGEDVNMKNIFQKEIDVSGTANVACYKRNYVAKNNALNYIQAVDDINRFCYLFFYIGTSNTAVVVNYENVDSHHIKLKLQIPLEDLMKISKFTITNGKE